MSIQPKLAYERLKRFRLLYTHNCGLDFRTGLITVTRPTFNNVTHIGKQGTAWVRNSTKYLYVPFYFEEYPVIIEDGEEDE